MNHFLTTTALALSLCAAGLAHAQDAPTESEEAAEENAAEAMGVPDNAAALPPPEQMKMEAETDAEAEPGAEAEAGDAAEDSAEAEATPEPANPDAASDAADPAAPETPDTDTGSDQAGTSPQSEAPADAAAGEDAADEAATDGEAAGGDAADGEAATATAMDDQARSTVTEIWEPVPETVDAPADAPPSDAVVLFDGTSLDAWESVEGGAAPWDVEEGVMTVARGSGAIRTKESFCDAQLHIEWRSPAEIEGFDGQDRGNSGVFFQELYEVQVLDSSDNPTYANGQAASVYKQHMPLVNASRGPGEWQEYDIIFDAPEFSDEGDLEKPAYITVFHNGVVVQNHVELQGGTVWIGYPQYQAHGCAPIQLQDHDSSVSYRNIWIRPM